MRQEKPTGMQRFVSAIEIVWTAFVALASTTVGAVAGWESHGLVGAVALGFAGLIIGIFLLSPSTVLELIS